MGRSVLLAVLAVALCVAGPAQADPLTQSLEGSVAGTLQQATTAAPAASAGVPAVRTVNEVTRTVTRSAGSVSEPAGTAVQSVASPATQVANAAVATPPPPSSSSPGALDLSPRALSSTRDRGPARALRAGRDRAVGAPAATPPTRSTGSVQAPPTSAAGEADRRGGPRGAPVPDSDPGQGGSAPASGTATAAATGLFCGGLALLAVALYLGGPRLVRRVSISPAACPPPAFASVLERPG